MDSNICYGGGIAHTLSSRCAEDEHDGAAARLNARYAHTCDISPGKCLACNPPYSQADAGAEQGDPR
jgi:hypothetical protein